MVKYLVGLATQFRNKKCVTYLAGLLIIIFEKSPPGQLNCRVAKYFWGQSPNGSVIWPGQLIGTQEYIKTLNRPLGPDISRRQNQFVLVMGRYKLEAMHVRKSVQITPICG